MTIYDPIASSLGLEPIDDNYTNAEYEHTQVHVPWNLGKPHMQKEMHPLWGTKRSDKTKDKMRKAALGRKASEKTKRKMSDIRKGRPVSDNFTMKGKKHSDETKQKISESSKGFSTETRQKQKEYMKGKKLPEYWTEALKNGRLGKKIYNNGVIQKMFAPDNVPEEFTLGKLRKE